MRGLARKVVAITGGAGDIGGSTVRRLSEEQARPFILDVLEPTEGNARSVELAAAGYYRCSQTDRTALDATLSDIAKREGRLDVLIVNAARTSPAWIAEMDMNEWRAIVELNLNGPVESAQIALQLMRAQDPDEHGIRGKILFTGSQCQQRPEHGGVAYQVTKRALQRFMEQLAYDYASEHILANMLLPGILMAGLTKHVVLTSRPELKEVLLDRIPLGEFGTQEQCAAAYAFLCSADSNYMTGTCLTVDGGCVLGRAERSTLSL